MAPLQGHTRALHRHQPLEVEIARCATEGTNAEISQAILHSYACGTEWSGIIKAGSICRYL